LPGWKTLTAENRSQQQTIQALREREKDVPWPTVLRYVWQEAQAGFAALIEVVVEGGHA